MKRFSRDKWTLTTTAVCALLAVACSLTASACGDDGPPTHDYVGPIAPCDVKLSDAQPAAREFEAARDSSAPDYWKLGPYSVWNTSPAKACADDPVMAQVGDHKDVALYITYPAASEPTVTGVGDVAPGKWPVIVFAHANNDTKCNIYRSYFSLHDHWASWGFVVASVDGGYTNCKPGTKQNIEERVQGELAAIDKLKALNEDPDSRFYGHLDLDKLILAGHSRGGGATLEAARRYGKMLGVIDIEGIDLTAFGFGSQTLPDFPVVGFTAGEDVDLNYPIVEPTEDQLGGPYTWVNINGAIHAYTADTDPIEPDDHPLIKRGVQHNVDEYFTTAFLARWVGVGDGQAPTSFAPDTSAGSILYTRHGTDVVDATISHKGVFQRWRSPNDAVWIDHFDGDTPDSNLSGGQNTCTGFDRCEEVATYQPDKADPWAVYAKSMSRLLETGDTGTFRVELGDVTAPAGASLQARVKGPDSGPTADFTVKVELADGSTFEYPGAEHVGPLPLSNRFTQLVIPGDDFAGKKVAAIAFDVSGGAIFLDDLRFVRFYK